MVKQGHGRQLLTRSVENQLQTQGDAAWRRNKDRRETQKIIMDNLRQENVVYWAGYSIQQEV